TLSSLAAGGLPSVAAAPPGCYGVAGAASWIRSTGAGAVSAMRLLPALMTGAFVATAIPALRRAAAPALLASGLVLAVTPMALFMGSSVNPSGVEIAASIALWACGIVLVATSGERVENRL